MMLTLDDDMFSRRRRLVVESIARVWRFVV